MRYLCVVFALLVVCGLAYADGDGTGILPFTSPNCSGQTEVHADGTVVVTGVYKGIPFRAIGTPTTDADGHSHAECDVYVDGEKARKNGGEIPKKIDVSLDTEDYTDGNPSDDPVGTVEVIGGPLGKGEVQLYG